MDITWAFMLDVVTATLAILVLSFIKVEKVQRNDAPAPVLAELKQGISYTFSHPLLRGIIICYACYFFLITPAAVLTPLLVKRSFGGEIWRLTANEMFWTAGTIVGVMSPSRQFRTRSPRSLPVLWCDLGLLGMARISHVPATTHNGFSCRSWLRPLRC